MGLGIRIRHRHHSTQLGLRKAHLSNLESIPYATCKVEHPLALYEGQKIVLVTSSTLHNSWIVQNFSANMHFEVITICGGKMKDGRLNFIHDYCKQPHPFNVTILMDLNDFKTTSVDDFHLKMTQWVDEVQVQVHQIKFNVINRISFIKFTRVPQQFGYPANRQTTRWTKCSEEFLWLMPFMPTLVMSSISKVKVKDNLEMGLTNMSDATGMNLV